MFLALFSMMFKSTYPLYYGHKRRQVDLFVCILPQSQTLALSDNFILVVLYYWSVVSFVASTGTLGAGKGVVTHNLADTQ